MIIVTGGAGFIGSALIWKLNEQGKTDIVVVDQLGDGSKWRNLAKRQIRQVVLKNDFFEWLAGPGSDEQIEAVFHMGASSATTVTDMDYLIENNINYSLQLWNFCAMQKVPLIYASSASTYGDGALGFSDEGSETTPFVPLNPYGMSKHKFDSYVLQHAKISPPFWAGLRFFNVYGPNEYHKGTQASVVPQFVPQVLSNGTIKLFKSCRTDIADGEQQRDFVYVKDCVDVMWHLLQNHKAAKSGVYNVGTGIARTWNDLAGSIFAAMDKAKKIEFIDMPKDLRDHYQYYTQAEMRRLRSDTGYDKSMTPIEAGVKDYVCNYLLTDDRYL